MKQSSVAIVGAGLAGLTCARQLVANGIAPVIFDKGRGLGGRLSTRRANGGYQFDHGAQYLTADSDGFVSLLHRAQAAGAVAAWPLDAVDAAFVGVPGMTGLAKFLATGLDIRKGARITRVLECDGLWQLEWDGGAEQFERVVVTAPAPQTKALLPSDHPFHGPLQTVGMDPCLALMVALPEDASVPIAARRSPSDDLSWVAFDSDKPGRPDAPCLVAHASPGWSVRNLELEMDEVAQRMLPLVSHVLGVHLNGDFPYLSAHRWRYALVSSPLGLPFLADETNTLFAAGDWCLGARAEDAWSSGLATAGALLETL